MSITIGYNSNLQEQLKDLMVIQPDQDFLAQLYQSSEALTEVFIGYGQQAFELMNSDKEQDGTYSKEVLYCINFEWGEAAKAYFILLNEVIFECQKGFLLELENQIDQAQLGQLLQDAATTLQNAKNELIDFTQSLEQSQADKLTTAKIKQWKLQQKPWPTYKAQLEQLRKQTIRLEADYKEMLACQQVFAKARAQTLTSIHNSIGLLSDNSEHLSDLHNELNLIQNNSNYNQYEKSFAHLRHIETHIKDLILQDSFSEDLDKLSGLLPEKCNWVIEPQHGFFLYLDIQLRQSVRTWLEEEILPLLNEIWELAEGSSNALRMLIYNLGLQLKTALNDKSKNTVLLLEKEQKTIEQLKRDIGISNKNILELQKIISERLQEVLFIHTAYQKEQLFEFSSRYARLGKYYSQSNRLISVAQRWLEMQWGKVIALRKSYQREKKLSISEKTVRCILSRKGDPNNSHYTSIFLTKGNVGEQFTVGREEDFAHATQMIAQWKLGFRGALLISGQRLSGKTLFAEIIATNHFQHNVIRLSPNSQLNFAGRKFNVEENLKEALQFVKKHAADSNSMLLIDDIEAWHSEDFSLSHNMLDLLRFVDAFSTNCFIVVCLNNYTNAYLNNFFNIEKYFQTEINMDGLSSNDVRQAIEIRHRATHKKLVMPNHEKAGPNYIGRLVRKIQLKAKGNIGEALTRWAHSTYCTTEDNVESRLSSYYHLPNFLDTDTGILLTTILLYKRMNEKGLRLLFGESFSEHYVHLIRRLINVGILVRQLDGWLEIETSIVNDLGQMLEHKGFIQYTKK